jgi:PPOX class probable F420-dependent enzyme
MDRAEALVRLAAGRVGHLATVRSDGSPHLVPVTFAISDDLIVTAIDQKPKTTKSLQRLANVDAESRVSLMVDHYDEEWANLWWVRADGQAVVHQRSELWHRAIEALVAKYDQYLADRPQGPIIAITPDRITYWESTP